MVNVGNSNLSKNISNVSWSTFTNMLDYKANWNNRQLIKIDRYFPSSKTCSSCGWINKELVLSDREWKCSSCEEIHDRDVNAAKNILKQGLNILSGCGEQSDVKQKSIEASKESMK